MMVNEKKHSTIIGVIAKTWDIMSWPDIYVKYVPGILLLWQYCPLITALETNCHGIYCTYFSCQCRTFCYRQISWCPAQTKPAEDNLEPTDNASVQGRVSLSATWTAPNLQLLWVFTADKDPHFVRPYRPHREVKRKVGAWKAQGGFSICEQLTWGVKDGQVLYLARGRRSARKSTSRQNWKQDETFCSSAERNE